MMFHQGDYPALHIALPMFRGANFFLNTYVTVCLDEMGMDGEGSLGEVAGICL